LTASKKALVIDDEESLRDVIREVLLLMDIETVPAESGEHALNLLAEHKNEIGFMLIDMFMPGMNGTETYRKICEKLGELPVIFMSGIDKDHDPDLAAQGKNKLFLKKPFMLNDLKEIVQQVLETSSK